MTPMQPNQHLQFSNSRRIMLTASRARTGVAGLERLLVAPLAEVVSASVDDDGALFTSVISMSPPDGLSRLRGPGSSSNVRQ